MEKRLIHFHFKCLKKDTQFTFKYNLACAAAAKT